MLSLGPNLWSFVALAVVFHWLFLVLLPYFSQWPLLPHRNTSGIEIEKWTDEKQIVQSSRLLNPRKDLDEKEARFGGVFKQRTERETQARLRGRFREGFPRELIPGASGELTDALLGEARNPYLLPKDVAEGGETVLNTDPVLFASFITRIADEIHDPWVQSLQEAVRNRAERGNHLESTSYITKLLVVIDSGGHVVAIQTLESSSVIDLDEAAKKSFWEVEPFPNPPSQMFEKDGVLRCVFEFHFEVKRSLFRIVPWAI